MLVKVLFLLAVGLSLAAGQGQVFQNIQFRTPMSANAMTCMTKIKQNQGFTTCSNNVRSGVWNGPSGQRVIDRRRACNAISNGLDCVLKLAPSANCGQQNLNELTAWANSMKPTDDGSRPVNVFNYTISAYSTICNRISLNAFGGIQFIKVNGTPGAVACFQKIVQQRNNDLTNCNKNVQNGVWDSKLKIKLGKGACKAISQGLDCVAKLANKTCTNSPQNRTQLLNWARGNKCTQVYVRNRTAGARQRRALVPCDQLCNQGGGAGEMAITGGLIVAMVSFVFNLS